MPQNKLQNYYNESCRIRGLIIDQTSKLEKDLDDFICQNLVGSYNKKIEFVKELFIENELMYAKKCKIAVGILKSKYKTVAIFNKYHKEIGKQLEVIGKVRNSFAHGITDLPSKLDFNNIKITISHKREKTPYTTNEINEHLKLIEKTGLVFKSYFNWKRLKDDDIGK